MAQAAAHAANATAADAVVAFIEYSEYKEYKIIVPEQFSPDDSKLLMQLQVLAIDAHAVSVVERDTIVNTAAWTTEGQPCVHINFCPVLRDAFDYSAFLPLSLVEKCGCIVAGVCVTSLAQCRQLGQRAKYLPLDLDNSLRLLLERLRPQRNTNLVHSDRQDTSDRSPSTTSAICSPSTLTTTTEARAITRRRRRNSSEPDEAPESKRARTTSTSRTSSRSILIQPTFSPTITSTSIPTAVPNLWMDLGLRVESSADAQCGNSMFPKVQQGWTNPMSVESCIGVLERAYPSGYPY
ncbi:hypothetical protein EJ07DRAFT_112047 [Lizonia empirigonia]|nr:hypothetical protein EJ07DRAFT_112047 [Lizonia empirigonia]